MPYAPDELPAFLRVGTEVEPIVSPPPRLTAQQRYRAAQAGDESRLPTFERTGSTLPGAVAHGLYDTMRMATTPNPALPANVTEDDAGNLVIVGSQGRTKWEDIDPQAARA